jgi:predicted kinase
MQRSASSVIAVFGTNCVGKSAVSLALAQRLTPCAVIPVDDLRHMMSDISVCEAESNFGESSAQQSRQFYLAAENAWLIARNFMRNGFSVIIDGLPQSQSQRRSIGYGRRVITVGLYCDAAILQSRRLARGWTSAPPASLPIVIEWYRANLGSFDCLIDTGSVPLEQTVAAILRNAFTHQS